MSIDKWRSDQSLPSDFGIGLPLTGGFSNGIFLIDNDPAKTGYAEYRTASPGYFAAMGIPLLRGRAFEKADQPGSPHVAVISQSLARKCWPNEDPIGRRIQHGGIDGDLRLLTIVGVVGDVREQLDEDVRPTVYANALQRPPSDGFVMIVRASVDPASLIAAMRQEVRSLNPEATANFRTLEQVFSSALDQRRFTMVLFAAFAAVALLLAVTGIYAVLAYTVSQRTREIGIRMAMGARPGDVLRLILGRGARLTAAGVVIGAGCAAALGRLITSILFEVSATDPPTFIVIAFLLMVVVLLACWIPARRAAQVDPMVALRFE